MDPIHGCIPLTQLEYDLLQLPALNRLHNIHHLGLAYLVYPAAKTSRLEHSLGVMHIASKMVYQILETSTPKEIKDVFDLNPSRREFAKNCYNLIQKVRLAALLHDIGHGPYSHVTESFLRKTLRDSEIKEAMDLFECKKEKDIPGHEYFSYRMLVDDSSEIKKIIESHKQCKIKTEEIAELLIKKETGNEATRILRKIISSQLDADRMDNLLRDSHATGVPFGLTDLNRVIHNIFISEYNGKYELVVHERALRGVEDILDARIKMYKSVYSHHLICALEKLLEEAINLMINDQLLKKEDFRFEKFLEGESTDDLIYFKLKEYQKNRPEFRAFFDRRYIPVAIIKRDLDVKNFIEEIGSSIRKEIHRNEVIKMFENWLKALEQKGVKMKISGESFFKDLMVLPSIKSFSPYKTLTEEERILVGRKGGKPMDLLVASPYVESLNREAEESQNAFFRLSFLFPNTPKNEEKKYFKKVKNILIKSIINSA